MKKILFPLFHILFLCQIHAQTSVNTDSIFKTKIHNDEYQVWLDLNFYDNDILVPQQEIFGEVPGYLGAKRDSRKWLITDAQITSEHSATASKKSEASATLTMINDYGSEDLTATLSYNPDGTYTLTQISGSPIKIVVDRKWVKLPKKLIFQMKQKRP